MVGFSRTWVFLPSAGQLGQLWLGEDLVCLRHCHAFPTPLSFLYASVVPMLSGVSILRNFLWRAGEMAHPVRCLPPKHKDLDSMPRSHRRAERDDTFVIQVLRRQRQADPWGLLTS